MKARINHILVLLIFSFSFISAQQHIQSSSQNTNYYFYQSSNNLSYISSIDGLNVYDGINTKIYKSSTHKMYGDNIQSEFYEDREGKMWFCTYEAINFHNPQIDSINYFFCKRENGEQIKNDYRIIDLENDTLWILADDTIFLYDVVKHNFINSFKSNVKAIFEIKRIKRKNSNLFLAISPKGFYSFIINDAYNIVENNDLNLPVRSFKIINDSVCIFGGIKGEITLYNYITNKKNHTDRIDNLGIVNLEVINDSLLYIISYSDIFKYNLNTKRIIDTIQYSYAGQKIDRLNFYKIIGDTHWISSDGTGIFYINNAQTKFKNWPLNKSNKPFVKSILPIEEQYLIIDRNKEYQLVNETGETVKDSDLERLQKKHQIDNGIFIDKSNYIFCDKGYFYKYNFENNKLRSLAMYGSIQNQFVSDFVQSKDNEFLFIQYPDIISKAKINDRHIEINNIFSLEEKGKVIESLFKIKEHLYLASNNEENLLVFQLNKDSLKVIATINIQGGIKSITKTSKQDYIYLGNYKGLFKLNINDYKYIKINGPNDVFNQTIYAIENSNTNEYWLSTNKGLYYWHEEKDSIHLFGIADGIQALEFNTNASYKEEDGRLFFGGVNGLNVFHPDSIKLMDHEVPVILTEYMLDDTLSTKFGPPHYVSLMELPYSQNTISFTFHSLDYADMKATRVKYKLEGYDDDFLVSKNNIGSIRYPNLPPGDYTFRIIGSNADRVWNKTERKVDIKILPPFWQRWWFRILSSLAILGIIYLIFRSYYSRILREKDFKLKEQELIISKQKALEAERNRIAGEMHDDLGGGLTTISYLSQRIKGKLEDEKSEKQLDKIINHAKSLVSNMSEIIWAMNSGFDSLENLIAYTRRYASEYCSAHDLKIDFTNETSIKQYKVSGEIRRNIFLVLKEILHNTVKHAKATKVSLSFAFEGSHLKIVLGDNGKGLQEENPFGNGLNNMEERIHKIDGSISRTSENGLHYEIKIPLLAEAK